jgi:uncharacterized protein (DUF2164 family)
VKKESDRFFEFTKEQLSEILPALAEYMRENFEMEISGMQAKFLINFITDELGKHYYNRGVEDAIAEMSRKIEDVYLLVRA